VDLDVRQMHLILHLYGSLIPSTPRLRWRLPKIIFIINRYMITSLLLLSAIPYTIFPLPISFCSWNSFLALWMSFLSYATTQIIMVIRLCSLYSNRKLVIWSLRGLLFLTLIGLIVSIILYSRTFHIFLYYEFLPGCFVYSSVPLMRVYIRCV